jgi:hypothetical protein
LVKVDTHQSQKGKPFAHMVGKAITDWAFGGAENRDIQGYLYKSLTELGAVSITGSVLRDPTPTSRRILHVSDTHHVDDGVVCFSCYMLVDVFSHESTEFFWRPWTGDRLIDKGTAASFMSLFYANTPVRERIQGVDVNCVAAFCFAKCPNYAFPWLSLEYSKLRARLVEQKESVVLLKDSIPGMNVGSGSLVDSAALPGPEEEYKDWASGICVLLPTLATVLIDIVLSYTGKDIGVPASFWLKKPGDVVVSVSAKVRRVPPVSFLIANDIDF